MNNYKGKLITDFRLSQDGYVAVDLTSIIPDEINFNDFLKELLVYFEKIRNYVAHEKEGIFFITWKEAREDGTPVCKITISAYPNKCKLMAQALSSNPRKFAHGFCHVWNKMSLQRTKYSEDELVELVKQCTVSNLDLAMTQTNEDIKAEDSTDTQTEIRNENVKFSDPINETAFLKLQKYLNEFTAKIQEE